MRWCKVQEITVTRYIWGRCGHTSSRVLPIVLPDAVGKLPLRVLQEDSHTRIDRLGGYFRWVQEVVIPTQWATGQLVLYQVTQGRSVPKHSADSIEQEDLLVWSDRKGVPKDLEIQGRED